ncbi:MFS transporter [Bacillus sp. FJAT-29790]|uniref:MFS transporter n=1 Tax=Bacillus sp. FJAT-29790 TaxID=1895002 RepID=UPI001C24B846|nr:MFS transporter [Bacillus sp. FJAT-29790]MBU8878232.1 MFS transporter [Bacillus sp. FJAT-29790]
MKRSRTRWLYVAPALFLLWAVGNLDKVGISVIVTNENFLNQMGLNGKFAEIGLLMTGFTLFYGLSSVFWGYVVDRIGPRYTAIIGLSLWSVSLILGGLAGSFGSVLVSRIILGFGEGIMFPMTNKFIAHWFHPKELGKAQSTWVYGQYLGPALGIPMLVWIIAVSSWKISFFTLAAITLVINIPLIFFLTRDKPSQHFAVNRLELDHIEGGQKVKAQESNMNHNFLKDKRYWLICSAFLMIAVLFYGISFWMPTYLEKARGFSSSEMGTLTSLSWIMAIIAVFITGYLADKTRRPAFMGSVIFIICAISLLLVSFVSSPIIAAIMLGIALSCVASQLLISQLLIVKYSSPKNTGKAAGIMGVLNIAGGFTTVIMGYIVDVTGGNYTAAMLFLVLFPFIGALSYTGIFRSEKKELSIIS